MVMEGQLATPNLHVWGSLEPETDLPAFHFQHRDDDLVPDYDSFANLATQH